MTISSETMLGKAGAVPSATDQAKLVRDLMTNSVQLIAKYYSTTPEGLALWNVDNGSYRKFKGDDYTEVTTEFGEYNGVALSAFHFNVMHFAPVGYIPSLGKIRKHGD